MRLLSWLRSLTQRGRVESEMDAELRFHIESFTDDLARQGVSRDEALRRARMEFGGIEARKEECRESLGLRLWDELRGDCRYALRMMRQNPGFTAVAVISLGLGIGANTAIFTFANEILMTSMAVPHAERLRVFNWEAGPRMTFTGHSWGSFGPGVASPFPYALYLEMRGHNDVMDDLAAFKDVYRLTATIDGQAEPLDGMLVSGNFYSSLGPRLIAGRGILPEDDSLSATPVAVISDAYWTKRFARSADVLGRTIRLNRVPITIVGINAPEFKGPKAGGTPEVFFPVSLQPQVIPNQIGSLLARHDFSWLMITGRLKRGLSDKAATAALESSFRNAVHTTLPETKDSELPRFSLISGSRGLDNRRAFAKPIYLLLALSGLVLLIACANLANLLLARSNARAREMSLRLAMGASRFRLMRQAMTEAMLLALLGGGAGLLAGYWGRNFIPSLFDDSWHPSGIDAQMDWRVFAFAFAITIVTGLLFGVAPAWRCTRADANAGLKVSGRMTTARPKALLGKALVVFQISLSLLLLVGAGLFLRTLINLRTAEIGFRPENILLFDVNPPRTRYPAEMRVSLYSRLEDKMAALPGVQSATLSAAALLANSMDNDCFRPASRPAGAPGPSSPDTNSIGPRFFETMGIPLVAGRSFNARDNKASPQVAIINQRLAKEFFPSSNPVGQSVVSCDAGAVPREIVGIIADAKYDNIRDAAPPTLYLPYLQDTDAGGMTFELKTAASLSSMVPAIREALRSVDKDLPLLEVRTQTQQIEATLSQERVFATLTTGFGALALILASIGIYGVMAYTVSRRTNEIGIRMALGARSGAVLGMVLRETMLLASIGVVAGLAGAAALTRLAATMLFGLKPIDPLTFGGAAVLLIGIALAAGFTPAQRAARVDPMNALRHE